MKNQKGWFRERYHAAHCLTVMLYIKCVMKALLINPWIYDFAAYNFWIRPLGLYHVAEWLWERGVEVSLVDALSPFKAPGRLPREAVERPQLLEGIPRKYSRYGVSPNDFAARIRACLPFDMVFVTSSMSYWYEGVNMAVSAVRQACLDAPVILGGIYATLWPAHARENSGANLVLEGPLEKNASLLCRELDLPVEPIRKRKKWYELGLHDGLNYAGVRTAYGCPFNCTYCGSRKISGPFKQRKPQEIAEELLCLHKAGVRHVSFYDDALLVDFDSRLKPVLDWLEKKNIAFTFHTPNGLHARLVTPTVARYFKKHGFKTIKLSLETVSPERQKATGAKVTNLAVKEAVASLLSEGIPRESIGIYLLAGLPDQDAREVAESINFVKALGVKPYLAEFSPIPGTPEWERLVKSGIITKDIDPILTNNTIFFRLYSKITEEDWKKLNRLRLES